MMKRIVRVLVGCIGAAFILNGIFLIIYANFTIGSLLTILAGMLLFLPSVFTGTFMLILSHALGKAVAVIAAILCLAIILSTVFLFAYGRISTVTYNEDYLVVLGCGLHGTYPTEPLRARLDTALDYLERNGSCKVIVSGGQGQGEDIPEAEAMRLYLVNAGIDNDRIITEDRSSSTYENFMYSNEVSDNGLLSNSAAFITNDFHTYRADSLAKMQGFHLNHISAPTSWYNIIPSYLREQLALVQMIVFNR